MALFTAAELRRIESKYEDGINSATVVDLFQAKGERFSEATLRKYVQLGLLPMSRRVGIRGRHRGSSGLYPVVVIRLINEVKRALDAGATLEDIKISRVALTGEVQVLRRNLQQLFDHFAETIQRHTDRAKQSELKRHLEKHRRGLEREVRDLEKFLPQLGDGD